MFKKIVHFRSVCQGATRLYAYHASMKQQHMRTLLNFSTLHGVLGFLNIKNIFAANYFKRLPCRMNYMVLNPSYET